MPYRDPDQQRAYQAQWMAKRRFEWFAGKQCVDCGSMDELRLDHQDATTKISHRIWSWSTERRERELEKCVPRCEPCHVAKTVSCHEQARGEANGRSKLTADLVREIRSRVAAGESKRGLAREYGVAEGSIRALVSGRTWSDVR